MKRSKLPFLPFPQNVALRLAKPFRGFAAFILKLNPGFKTKLHQAEIEIDDLEYVSLGVFTSFLYFLIVFFLLFFLSFSKGLLSSFLSSFLSAFLVSLVIAIQFLIYPSVIITKRSREIEKELLFALKYLLIKLRSGVPTYDAFVSVAQGNFGRVSKEFEIASKEMASGLDAVRALENMALRSPSKFFRKTIWQITNNIRAGSDITDVLESISESLVREQKILLRRYGAELNPIILMYMMLTVVIPSLGMTVLVVLGSFAGLEIPKYVFYIFPIFILVLQFFFLTLVKNKRPSLSL